MIYSSSSHLFSSRSTAAASSDAATPRTPTTTTRRGSPLRRLSPCNGGLGGGSANGLRRALTATRTRSGRIPVEGPTTPSSGSLPMASEASEAMKVPAWVIFWSKIALRSEQTSGSRFLRIMLAVSLLLACAAIALCVY